MRKDRHAEKNSSKSKVKWVAPAVAVILVLAMVVSGLGAHLMHCVTTAYKDWSEDYPDGWNTSDYEISNDNKVGGLIRQIRWWDIMDGFEAGIFITEYLHGMPWKYDGMENFDCVDEIEYNGTDYVFVNRMDQTANCAEFLCELTGYTYSESVTNAALDVYRIEGVSESLAVAANYKQENAAGNWDGTDIYAIYVNPDAALTEEETESPASYLNALGVRSSSTAYATLLSSDQMKMVVYGDTGAYLMEDFFTSLKAEEVSEEDPVMEDATRTGFVIRMFSMEEQWILIWFWDNGCISIEDKDGILSPRYYRVDEGNLQTATGLIRYLRKNYEGKDGYVTWAYTYES